MSWRDRFKELFELRGNLPALALSEITSSTGWNMFEVIWQPYVLSLDGTIPILGGLSGL